MWALEKQVSGWWVKNVFFKWYNCVIKDLHLHDKPIGLGLIAKGKVGKSENKKYRITLSFNLLKEKLFQTLSTLYFTHHHALFGVIFCSSEYTTYSKLAENQCVAWTWDTEREPTVSLLSRKGADFLLQLYWNLSGGCGSTFCKLLHQDNKHHASLALMKAELMVC